MSRQHVLAQESVELCRLLADANPQAYLPGLAHALDNQSRILAGAGQDHAALAASEEAVAIWRRLVEAGGAEHRQAYAAVLTSHAQHLAGVGRRTDGLAAAEEAVELLRTLEAVEPRALAAATGSLGRRLAETGRTPEALEAARTAVALRRRLVEPAPANDAPANDAASNDAASNDAASNDAAANDLENLAIELRSLSNAQSRLGRHDEAKATAEEAVSVLRGTGERGPILADGLRQLSGLLARDPGQAAEALRLAQEATAIRRGLHLTDPDPHRFGLMVDLLMLSQRLAGAGRMADALPVSKEARSIALALMESAPDPVRFQLVFETSLEFVMARLELGRELPEALDTLDAMEHLLSRPPARQEPGRRDEGYLKDVRTYRAYVLTELGRPEEALEIRRAQVVAERHDQTLRRVLDPARRPFRRFFGMSDLADLDHDRGAEALAALAVTAPDGSWVRALARRWLRRRVRLEYRAGRKSGLPTPHTPSAAALLADTLAHDAVDTDASPSNRLAAARRLHKLGDPRGIDLIVAFVQDPGMKRRVRREAADLLVKMGDPRGRYLLADLLAEEVADGSVGRVRRALASDELAALDESRAAELRAARIAGVELDPADRQQFGWPHTAPTLAGGVLRDVSPGVAVALDELAAARKPRRVGGYGWGVRCLALISLPLPAVFALLTGEAVAEAGSSRPGPGNWIALCVSSLVLLMVMLEVTGQTARLAARVFGAGPTAESNLIGGYVILMPLLAVAGYFVARPLLGFPAAAGRILWNVLIWR